MPDSTPAADPASPAPKPRAKKAAPPEPVVLPPAAPPPATSALAPVAPTAGLDLSHAMAVAAQLGKDGVEVLERLHVIAKEERRENARAACTRAMAAFKAEMPVITKVLPGQHSVTKVGTRTKGMYAPLDTITQTLDPVATRHGLSYRFDREVKDGKDYIVCIVSHEGGHEFTSRFPAPADTGPGRNAIQAIASGDSYAKRYALIAAFGITTADPDDDAKAAGGDESGETLNDEQKAAIEALLKEMPGERDRFLAWQARVSNLPVAKVGDILASNFARARSALAETIAEKRKAAP